MNLVVLKGNLTRDPEVKPITTRNNKTTNVANFTIAVSRFFKKADGNRDKITTFIPCEAWDTGADTIAKILKKGDPVLVQGSLKVDSWEQDDGQKRSRIKVRVNTFDKLNRASYPQNNDGYAGDDTDDTDDVNDTDDTNDTDIDADDTGVEGQDIPF
jgi:single-strand DNA-binding protein